MVKSEYFPIFMWLTQFSYYNETILSSNNYMVIPNKPIYIITQK